MLFATMVKPTKPSWQIWQAGAVLLKGQVVFEGMLKHQKEKNVFDKMK